MLASIAEQNSDTETYVYFDLGIYVVVAEYFLLAVHLDIFKHEFVVPANCLF